MRIPIQDAAREAGWRRRLEAYYREFSLAADAGKDAATRSPFTPALCDVVLEYKPRVVSFHFGLPDAALVRRLKDARILVISSATTAEEARWLEGQGCDAVIAQGNEAGGHRGMFMTDDIARQAGTMALVPQVVDAVKVPGDRRRRHRRRARDRGGAGARRGRRADRHGLPARA